MAKTVQLAAPEIHCVVRVVCKQLFLNRALEAGPSREIRPERVTGQQCLAEHHELRAPCCGLFHLVGDFFQGCLAIQPDRRHLRQCDIQSHENLTIYPGDR